MYQILFIVVFAGLAATTPPNQDGCKVKDNNCLGLCNPLIETIDPSKIVFRLFTNSTYSPQVIEYNDDSTLQASFFNQSHPTRFIIHGLCNDGESGVNRQIRSAYVEHGQYNIFVVDWEEYASISEGLCINNRTADIGAHIGKFVNWLSIISGPLKPISVIGYSLGAHVAGHVGKYLNSIADEKLHTIIALDPSIKCFFNQSIEDRVASTDAEYVEVIHTSYLAIHTPIGTADFYPYWGSNQPGCNGSFACSHRRAYQYYAESIRNSSRFMSIKCLDYKKISFDKCTSDGTMIKMGGEPSNHGLAEGIYYNDGINLINHMFLTFIVIMFVFVKAVTV